MASIARVTEIISSSKKSFEDATVIGVARACKTLKDVKGAWVKDQKVDVESGKIRRYRVTLMVTLVLKDWRKPTIYRLGSTSSRNR